MNKINIDYINSLGWIVYPKHVDAPENCFYKKPYPIALWWDQQQEGFWVVHRQELSANPIIVGCAFIATKEDYDDLMIPILREIQGS